MRLLDIRRNFQFTSSTKLFLLQKVFGVVNFQLVAAQNFRFVNLLKLIIFHTHKLSSGSNFRFVKIFDVANFSLFEESELGMVEIYSHPSETFHKTSDISISSSRTFSELHDFETFARFDFFARQFVRSVKLSLVANVSSVKIFDLANLLRHKLLLVDKSIRGRREKIVRNNLETNKFITRIFQFSVAADR